MPYLSLVYLAVLVLALVDIIRTDDAAVRGLPKLAWVMLVILLPLIGALLWLGIGRPAADEFPRRRSTGSAPEFPEYERPGRYVPADPDADRAFLQSLRDRAEEQRRIAREQQSHEHRRPADSDDGGFSAGESGGSSAETDLGSPGR